MEENVFMTGGKALTLEDYLQYDAGSRDNLGEELPVMVYRLLEYSLKEELIGQFGKEKQIEIFRNAGRKAGEYFAKKMLNLDQPLDQFVSELQSKMQELKIGVLRIEKVDEESGKVYGLYILHPNNVGRCGHIANASYAVFSSCRGLHAGEKLVRHSIKKAAEIGFSILQFNAVVATNVHARHLYERIGFKGLGVIRGGFRMKDGHFEDICPYYIECK